MILPYSPYLKSYSKNLRNNMTEPELILWSKIRKKQILGVQFNRQKPIGRMIVDFYADIPKLIIELDGGQHFEDKKLIEDKERDQFFSSLGLWVLRFNNDQILNELDAVLDKIYQEISKRGLIV